MTTMAACRPVEWSERTLGRGAAQPETPVYPNSLQMRCDDCKEPIWVGPKQQDALATGVVNTVLCFDCAARTVSASGEKPLLSSLGNSTAGIKDTGTFVLEYAGITLGRYNTRADAEEVYAFFQSDTQGLVERGLDPSKFLIKEAAP